MTASSANGLFLACFLLVSVSETHCTWLTVYLRAGASVPLYGRGETAQCAWWLWESSAWEMCEVEQ